MYYRSLM